MTDFRDVPYLQARINLVLEREPTGAEVEWRNVETGNSGVIRVLRTYFPSPKAPCREYERTTRQPSGPDALVRGTGCRDADGRWRLKEEEGAGGSKTPGPDTPVSEPREAGTGAGAPTSVTTAAGETTGTGSPPAPPKPEAASAPPPKAAKTAEKPAPEIAIELPTRSD